jgi:hypothetical protein
MPFLGLALLANPLTGEPGRLLLHRYHERVKNSLQLIKRTIYNYVFLGSWIVFKIFITGKFSDTATQ